MRIIDFFRQLIIWDVIFGARTKKLAGINDSNNKTRENVTFSATENCVIFPEAAPKWLQVGEYFRVFGGNNDSRLFRIKEIQYNKVFTYEQVRADTGSFFIDARLWVIHNDSRISRPTSTGSTMFNVHNRGKTIVPDDASAISSAFAEHYHDEEGTDDDVGELISEEYNELGYRSKVLADCCEQHQVDLGPQLIFDNDGNVIRVRKDDKVEVC